MMLYIFLEFGFIFQKLEVAPKYCYFCGKMIKQKVG